MDSEPEGRLGVVLAEEEIVSFDTARWRVDFFEDLGLAVALRLANVGRPAPFAIWLVDIAIGGGGKGTTGTRP